MTQADLPAPPNDAPRPRDPVLQCWRLLGVAAALLGLVPLMPMDELRYAAGAAGGAVAATAVLVRAVIWRRDFRRRRLGSSVAAFVGEDATPSFATDRHGVIVHRNGAALDRFGGGEEASVLTALGGLFADPAGVLRRLRIEASAYGSAREDVAHGRGHARLAVHRIAAGGYLWRLQEIADRRATDRPRESAMPMMTLGGADAVLSTNSAMRDLLGERRMALAQIVTDLPLRPGDRHVLAGRNGPVAGRIVVIELADDTREVYFLGDRAEGGASARASNWQALDKLPVALLRVSATGEVLTANKLARELLGDEMAVGMPLSILVEGLGRPIDEWVADASDGHGLGRSEVVRASRQPRDVFLQITLSRVVEEDFPVLVAVLNDATELKTLEAQFVQSQKMQAIGQLAGGVAHDFNNLLTAISGHCDLLLLRHDETDVDYGDLMQISQNANRAASLVGQLLAFSRKQNLQPQILDLRETMGDLAHLLNRLVGEKVRLELNHDPATKMVRVDHRQFEQVMMNLVVNARDAMPEGGTIRIETKMTRLDRPMTRDRATVPVGEYVSVVVADEGVGIPSDKLPKIFEPFFTTKQTGEGTGLGLSTAYGIIKQTGGFIFADSAVGVGSKFILYLPAHDAPPPQAEAAPPEIARPGAQNDGVVVLLVEDEAPVRAFAARALKMRGFSVIEAESGEDALARLEDPGLVIDVFVTDVIMPGLDGPTWVRRALEQRPGTHVVFVSGYAEDGFSDIRMRIPNSVFLPKPFSLGELTHVVQEQIAEAPSSPSRAAPKPAP